MTKEQAADFLDALSKGWFRRLTDGKVMVTLPPDGLSKLHEIAQLLRGSVKTSSRHGETTNCPECGCSRCDGEGDVLSDAGVWIICPDCKGRGRIPKEMKDA